jgi:hypothetical protein
MRSSKPEDERADTSNFLTPISIVTYALRREQHDFFKDLTKATFNTPAIDTDQLAKTTEASAINKIA